MAFYKSLRNSLYLRYGLGLMTILFSIYMIQAINLNSAVQKNTKDVENKINAIEQENIFLKEFYLPYLESDLAYQVLAHEQGQTFPGEKIVRLEHRKTSSESNKLNETNAQVVKPLPTLHPHEAWKVFIEQIIKKNFGN
jgi:hypothetical protein